MQKTGNKRVMPPLHDWDYEHDSCGVGFMATLNREPEHRIIEMGLEAMSNLTHRGAVGGDNGTGDGAGLLFQIPHEFFQAQVKEVKDLQPGEYGVGQIFFPHDKDAINACRQVIESVIREEGMGVLGWREVPVDDAPLGDIARDSQPHISQVFIDIRKVKNPEQKLYISRRVIENKIEQEYPAFTEECYICSLSSKLIVYKGMLLAHQIPVYYHDLEDKTLKTRLVIIHQRYSTNTFPSWKLAQPFRYLAHNGEINTLRGNINKMRAREQTLASDAYGDEMSKLFPIIQEGGSDSACFDNCYELLVNSGKTTEESLMMMIPEAFGKKYYMSEDRRSFYEYFSSVMEPWDGPAAMLATDGDKVTGTLDRNGLRPCRYVITHDGYITLGSEIGMVEVKPENVKKLGRLQPGKMLTVDTVTGKVLFDNEVKSKIVRRNPYRRWIEKNRIELRGLFAPPSLDQLSEEDLLQAQQVFGYNVEEMKMELVPMVINGREPIGSMGIDIPLAVLSDKPQPLFNYFKQLFAQVTNPPIDPYRESLVMSLMSWLGRKRNILEESPEHCRQLKLPHPILSPDNLVKIEEANHVDLKVGRLSICFDANGDGKALKQAIEDLCAEAVKKTDEGCTVLILSDRDFGKDRMPIPSLLALSAVHQHLIREHKRLSCGIIVESGEVRTAQHYAVLLGYGANAICPYLAFQTIVDMYNRGDIPQGVPLEDALDNYINAVKKGLLKTLSRMGISTLRSYQGAQIFEAVGVSNEIIDAHFTGTVSRIGGVTYDILATETRKRHEVAFPRSGVQSKVLDYGGYIHQRNRGERHIWNAQSVAFLRDACVRGNYETYKQYADLCNKQEKALYTLRGMFKFKDVTPISIDEVEPVSEITKRFVTGAMSYGSISKEAHESLAIAMNRIGGQSNTGEGGEDPERFKLMENGDNRCSKIKQVASGRFGVTVEYLANSQEMQIKIAQGAKPGEGGQLPGHKVNEIIAKVRNSTPGVTLISPPPHHDIYSIEDIAQLIFDLKCANVDSRVSVKLVSEVGVATVAAGVAKAKSDMVLVSGYDGGTGASPIASIQHAGIPWELGLAETQQVLVENQLRDKIRVQVDGGMKTGRDVVIAAMLGAEEYGFCTAALVAMGCCLLRKCHQNTCTMGVATQDPDLRKLFAGSPDHVVNFFTYVASEAREYMASVGVKSIDELIGRTDLLEVNPKVVHWKASSLDFDKILYHNPDKPLTVRCTEEQDHMLETSLDYTGLLEKCKPAIEDGKKMELNETIRNIHRTVGTMISGAIAKKYGSAGLPEDTLKVKFTGSAGQSFGAFLAPGVTFELEGYSNDYLGKGLSGGKIIVYPPKEAGFDPGDNIVVGNTLLYGATAGEVYIQGAAGERFCVRNSGVKAVIEGVGDHGCEYMTGGTVVILGRTGLNFAAGMSGGIAYVWDPNQTFDTHCNLDMIDLEPVECETDCDELKRLIQNHYDYTGSDKARYILDNWDYTIDSFVKVFPIDYKAALERMKQSDFVDSDTLIVTEETEEVNRG
jgi:glutamate synthase (NADPH/NADH) large chain